MKLRLGFVTNSSSTNFVIAWKGKKEDLKTILESHRSIFPKFDMEFELGANEITNLIIKNIMEISEERIKPAGEYFIQYQDNIDYLNETIIETNDNFDLDSLEKRRNLFNTLCNCLIDKDFAMNVSFGDNHGDFQDSSGPTMRSLGPDFYSKDDFMIFNTKES
jgi:hypothetical protein